MHLKINSLIENMGRTMRGHLLDLAQTPLPSYLGHIGCRGSHLECMFVALMVGFYGTIASALMNYHDYYGV